MSESISSTVNRPVSFSLEVYGSAARRIEKAAAKQVVDDAAAHRAKLKQVRLENQILAAEWAGIMMRKSIEEALDPATDPRLRRDLRNDVLAHGVGKPREVESETAESKRKGSDESHLLAVLAALSAQAQQSQLRLERDVSNQITTDDQALQLLQEITQQRGLVIDHEEGNDND
ncbi:hypothetical protein HP546_19055 [Pseudomonas sp. CM25]|uniref:hypothetical protein n=1 Tax=Pseudomonas sp. CM25 TaxID=2738448 RepID=UPI00155597CC|nr:hypothetical protein [Pseudomonas sp. CM25]NQD57438.1 hypothetical protein [Pseudomonas sp. CM25]